MKKRIITMNANTVMGGLTVWLGVGVILESARIYQYARSFLTGDHIVPGIAGIILALLGLDLIFFVPAPVQKPTFPKGQILRRILGTAALMAAYLVLMNYIGYVVSTLAASYGLFRVFGKYPWKKSAVMALLTTLFVWIIFIAWLNMPFPRGVFKYMNLPF